MGHSSGAMAASMRDNSKTTTSKDLATMFGLMGDNLKEAGKTTKCMGGESSSGPMEDAMMESTSPIKKKGLESLAGQMGGATEANGKMENKTAGEFTATRKESKEAAHG